jgi:hypothetical protein
MCVNFTYFFVGAIRLERKLGIVDCFFAPLGQGWPTGAEKQYPLPNPRYTHQLPTYARFKLLKHISP